jgi:hypothetical protein
VGGVEVFFSADGHFHKDENRTKSKLVFFYWYSSKSSFYN